MREGAVFEQDRAGPSRTEEEEEMTSSRKLAAAAEDGCAPDGGGGWLSRKAGEVAALIFAGVVIAVIAGIAVTVINWATNDSPSPHMQAEAPLVSH
jgi:hypothetical protein